MTQEEIIELKEELQRVKLLLQKCNGDIVRADRELNVAYNKAVNDAIEQIQGLKSCGGNSSHQHAYKKSLEILSSLKVDL